MFCTSLTKKLFRVKSLQEGDVESTKLSRVLTSFDLTLLGIGSTLGVGIYVLAGEVAKESAGPAVIISFLIAAITSAFAGFCYAEFGARVPKSGSAYTYCYCTVGEFIAFLIGWNLILEYIIGTASVTKVFSTYLDELFENKISDFLMKIFSIKSTFLGEFPDFLAFGIVMVFSLCLAFGLRGSTTLNNVFTSINLCVVAFVIITGSINAKIENWSIPKEQVPEGSGEGGFAPFGMMGIIKGAATCFYGFIGFDCIAATGEEAKNPRKSIPLAIVTSLFVVFLTYFGVSAVSTLMWPYYDQNLNAPLSSIFEAIGWITAKWVVSIGALFGLLPSLLGSLLPLPRIIFAMAGDGLMFQIFGKVSEKYQSPVFGTVFFGFFTGIMAMIFNLSQLIDMMSIGTLLAYTIVAACVLLLRYQRSDEDDPVEEFSNLSFPEKLSKHLLHCGKLRAPTALSSSLVSCSVFLYCIVTFAAMFCFTFLLNDLANGKIETVTLFSALIIIEILLLVIIASQPKSRKKLYFQVPCIPLVPAISISFNMYLMLMLDAVTWIRFGIWMVFGVIIYFTYGIRKSILNEIQPFGTGSTESKETIVTSCCENSINKF